MLIYGIYNGFKIWINKKEYKVFIKAFIYSSIQKRLSSNAFIFESLDIVSAYNIIKSEKSLNRGNDIYIHHMSWHG